ncbi:MAG TPA: hypothetical protein VFA18_17055 [Gemmataceae bacterium]|nr:hypothetical protein [Gemmataceae bacterium]
MDAWLERWGDSLPFLPANEGCGCCVDIYRVDAPPEALEQLPPSVFTASDWSEYHPLACLPEMLASISRTGKASDRKLRLSMVGCCRHAWDILDDSVARSGVEMAERYADGDSSARQLAATCQRLREYIGSLSRELGYLRRIAIEVALYTVSPTVTDGMVGLVAGQLLSAWYITDWQTPGTGAAGFPAWRFEHAHQLGLLRDVLGDPSRSWHALAAGLLTPDVLALARSAYENRALPEGTLEPARLAALADALEAAGCTDSEVLAHLRSLGPHTRGCWAVDLILDRT